MADEKSQTDKFKEAARTLECDDDPQRFEERVGKLVKHKPVGPDTKKGRHRPPPSRQSAEAYFGPKFLSAAPL